MLVKGFSGSVDEQAGSMEEDAVKITNTQIQDTHQDNGHSHVDAGHTLRGQQWRRTLPCSSEVTRPTKIWFAPGTTTTGTAEDIT